ncbi:MAG: alpha/beta hydrolase family protein [Alkalispirochaeta sp.]
MKRSPAPRMIHRLLPRVPAPLVLVPALILLVTTVTIALDDDDDVPGAVEAFVSEGTILAEEIDSFIAPLFAGYTVPQAQHGAEIYTLFVRTRYPDGALTSVRVQLFVPRTRTTPDAVYLFAPGSTGLIGPCRASREHEAGIHWGRYRAHVLAMVGQGFIGVLPDYMGFEDPALVQPYFHAASEAQVIFDALDGSDAFLRDRYRARFPRGIAPMTRVAGGFSQGGHAIFAAADRNATVERDVSLHGVIGYGSTTEIEPLLLMYPSLGPMIATSYVTVYGRNRFDPSEIFREPWASDLEYDTTRQCVGGIQRYYPSDPSALYTPEFLASLRRNTLGRTHPSIARIFEENRTGLTRHGVPALILQGTEDIVVSRETQDRYVAALRARGNPVDYRIIRDERHDTRQVAFDDTVEWIRTLPGPTETGPADPLYRRR